MSSSRSSDRLADFKYNSKTLEARRQERGQEAVELRKQNRIAQIMKRRNIDYESEPIPESTTESMLASRIAEITAALGADNRESVAAGVLAARQMLAQADGPPINEFCEAGAVPKLVRLLHMHDEPFLQLEAAWCLTNITSGSTQHTQHVIECEAVPILAQLLSSENYDIQEQSVWTLGNISGDNEAFRDHVLDFGAVEPIAKIIVSQKRASLVKTAIWTLANLCRGKNPHVDFEKVAGALQILHRSLHSDDTEILTDACWALSYLADCDTSRIERVIRAGVVGQLVSLLMHPRIEVVTPALRAIGNIASGSDCQTQVVLNNNALPAIRHLLFSPHNSLRKEACWALSNICAGTSVQIDEIIEADIFGKVAQLLLSSEFATKKEALWCIANATVSGSDDCIRHLVKKNCIAPMCKLLQVDDVKLISVTLDGLTNILQVGYRGKTQPNEFHGIFEACGGLEKFEMLQMHPSAALAERSTVMIETFLSWTEEMETGDLNPDTAADGSQFMFNPSGQHQQQHQQNFNF